MNIDDLKNKLVAVLGYGQEGEAVTKFLLKHGIKPVLFDQRSWDKWPKDKQEEIKKLSLNFVFGPDCFKELAGFDAAFRSPGIKFSQLTINNLLLTSQTKWFFDNCPAKIIGVTGTKGKGTTASLIFEILQANSYKLKAKSYLTGNIGKTQPFDIIDNLTEEDKVVYELSSFQLQDLRKSPHIAVVLMATSEHLDYHKNKDEYLTAKSTITKFQTGNDFAVINADYPASVEIGKQGKGQKIYFSTRKELEHGCYIRANKIVFPDSNFQYPISNIQLKGKHNLENICAAVAVGAVLDINGTIIQKAIDNFKGLEHRLEFVVEKKGIKFYNDSFSTTPETAIAAIQSFNEPLIVILGGSSKNSDFTSLAKTIATSKHIKILILIGQEAGRIKRAIERTLILVSSTGQVLNPSPIGRGGGERVGTLEGAASMPEIFEQVKSAATSGDVVLLSPACASFDMFKNYQDRGDQFKDFAKRF